MKTASFIRTPMLASFLAAALAGGVRADLPTHTERAWQTDFAGHQARRCTLRINSGAEGVMEPVGDNGKPVSYRILPKAEFIVEEVRPDGKTFVRKLDYDTLETEDKPFLREGKAVFRGKTKGGGAEIEGHIAITAAGELVFGGRITNPDKLKNPQRLGVRLNLPTLYHSAKKEGRDAKAFEKQLKSDRYQFVRTDGSKGRLDGMEKLTPEMEKHNGPRLSEFTLSAADYRGRIIEAKASPNSAMFLHPKKEQLPYQGLTLLWFPDPAKDPETEARITIRVR